MFIFLVAVLAIWIIFVKKPWVPKGNSDPEAVMSWCNKHDRNIYDLSAWGQLDEGFTNGRASNGETIILMKNTKSNTYVFKINGHYVYMARIMDHADDSYWEQIVGIAKDDNGNVYHHGLSRSEMSATDDSSVEDTSWTDSQFNRDFDVD
ncbi:hypothetical protein FC75_GL002114 [Lacticaseibacillus camelliae DSM 22697 = JCM 13995]|uniref:Uncharacterized protein n=1 Tax=Lacticaseibacillus camelliae DSM 22697 = JCM 13995 TaxID=1423730 RepID=A0A0R2F1G2_9LACO|nr:hypothetical protein FC75_GL002114 [Lacticaseibacillus camelliae DSM 22697 = JCM 13995]